ncbi:hypothetical protein ACFX5K_00215 [Rickettsiales bacterium LUAb2]
MQQLNKFNMLYKSPYKLLLLIALLIIIIIALGYYFYKSKYSSISSTTPTTISSTINGQVNLFGGNFMISRISSNKEVNAEKNFITEDQANNIISILDKSQIKLNYVKRAVSLGKVEFNKQSIDIKLVGIDPDNESSVFNLANQDITGDFLSSEEYDGAVVSASVAEKLNLQPNDNITYVTYSSDNKKITQQFRVSGIINNTTDNIVIINLETFQSIIFNAPLIGSFIVDIPNKVNLNQANEYLHKEIDTKVYEISSITN